MSERTNADQKFLLEPFVQSIMEESAAMAHHEEAARLRDERWIRLYRNPEYKKLKADLADKFKRCKPTPTIEHINHATTKSGRKLCELRSLMLRLFKMRSEYGLSDWEPPTPTQGDGANSPATVTLDKESMVILKVLANSKTFLKLVEIAERTDETDDQLGKKLDRGTVSDRLKNLEKQGYVKLPEGVRSGWIITAKGRALIPPLKPH